MATKMWDGNYSNLAEKLNAKAFYIYDLKNKKVLCQKNPDKKLYIGSITKLAAALLVVESGQDLLESIVVPKRLEGEFCHLERENACTVGLKTGDSLTRMQLLELSMIPSACDTISVLADAASAGHIDEFISSMNAYVKQCDIHNTQFSSVHGVYEDTVLEPFSTARDVAILMQTIMAVPLLRKIVSTKCCIHPFTQEILYHTNQMMHQGSQVYRPYVTGGKTGSTDAAGMCLTFIADYDEQQVLVVVLGAPYTIGQKCIAQIYYELVAALDLFLGFNNLKA